MPNKIEKGKLITELVKGSYNYTIHVVRRAFYKEFPDLEDEYFWVEEIFESYLIVSSNRLKTDEFYRVGYLASDSFQNIQFDPREEWESVELTYQLASTIQENKSGVKGEKRLEIVEKKIGYLELDEAAKKEENRNGPWRVKGHGLTAGVVNLNNHRYPMYASKAAVRAAQERIELNKPGTLVLTGEVDHPTDKGKRGALLGETVFIWDRIYMVENEIKVEGLLLPTSKGRDLYEMARSGVVIDLSQRAWGEVIEVDEDGEIIDEIVSFFISGYDAVTEGGDQFAGVEQIESKNPNKNSEPSEDESMTKEELAQAAAELEKARQEARKAVGVFIDAQVNTLTQFGADVRKKIVEAVKGEKPEDTETAQKLINEKSGEYEVILADQRAKDKALREQLGIAPHEDIATVLAEREAKRIELETKQQAASVQLKIDEIGKTLKYPAIVTETYIEAVRADNPTSVAEVEEAFARHKANFSKMASKLQLSAKGFNSIDVVGPVLEAETGFPQFAIGSYMLLEQMQKRGLGIVRDPRKPKTRNERFMARYLELFDKNYQHQLVEESRLIEEAETTTDLNLPYTAARSVMAEVWPELVAGGIFDFDIAVSSPERLYYEEHVGESGATGTITNEDFNSGAFTTENGISQGDWVKLAHGQIIPGTVVVNVDGGGNLITDDDTNYVVNYNRGSIKMLDGGSSASDVAASTAYEIDYQYYAYREGEGAEIQEAKTQLVYKTLEIEAVRLATDISKEAIVFSKSQVGWDAVTRTLSNLAQEIRTRIDQGVFYLAVSAAASVANNSGGTWTAASDTLQDLVEKLGVAKVKVLNRYYMANAIIASSTNMDRLANWDGFTAAGARPDADIDAAGYVGRVKGLPCFETVNFGDGYFLVVNRQLVMHRVFQAMMFEGPFHKTGSNGKLVANKLYYAEEFNGTDAPKPEKGSYVKVA